MNVAFLVAALVAVSNPGDSYIPADPWRIGPQHADARPSDPSNKSSKSAAASDAVLLDFGADWCGYCRQMEPVIGQLAAMGYPVRKVNADRERALADKYGVQGLPCFVMLVDGREVDRFVGTRDHDGQPLNVARFEAMFRRNGVGSATSIAGAPLPGAAPAAAVPFPASDSDPAAIKPASVASLPADSRGPNNRSYDRLIRSSVRLKIEDDTGNSVGSGTIIDARAGEALIITCGHVFRDAAKDGRILVDLFGPDAPHALVGHLIDYDLKSEVGIISIRTSYPLVAARLAPPGYTVKQADRVISIGCDSGADATVKEAHVTSINRYAGAPNLEVDFQPVQGRSGGGLFTPDGYVVGVCYAADPEGHEGLFSALPALCDELDRAGLAFVYKQGSGVGVPGSTGQLSALPRAQGLVSSLRSREIADPKPENPIFDGPNAPIATSLTERAPQNLSADEQAALAAMRDRADGSQMICIMRSSGDSGAKNEIIVLDHVSEGFIERLAAESASANAQRSTPR
jgi:thiol-disulfide isomerase/thioredoxin